MSDDQKAAAVDGVSKAVSMAAAALGQNVAASTAEALGQILVDALVHGTLDRLTAHARAAGEVLNSEAAAEIAARSRK